MHWNVNRTFSLPPPCHFQIPHETMRGERMYVCLQPMLRSKREGCSHLRAGCDIRPSLRLLEWKLHQWLLDYSLLVEYRIGYRIRDVEQERERSWVRQKGRSMWSCGRWKATSLRVTSSKFFFRLKRQWPKREQRNGPKKEKKRTNLTKGEKKNWR